MTNFVKLLQQQITKHLSKTDISNKDLQAFLKSINDTYKKLDHSLTLSAEELFQTNQEIQAIFQAIPDQLLHLDKTGKIITYKSGSGSHHYFSTEKLINKSIVEITSREISHQFISAIEDVISNRRTVLFEFVEIYNKKTCYYEVRMMLVKSDQVIAIIRDISEKKLVEDQMAYMAYHDSLTGLPNNHLFRDRVTHCIASAKRNNTKLAVMFLDLDRFKLINDTLGHSTGDKLLQATAERLQNCIRSSDSIALNSNAPINPSIARLGGDEFIILLESIVDIKVISRIAERMVNEINQPIYIGQQEVFTSSSIGIALYPDDGKDVDTLLKNADAAMYYAKDQGRNNFQYYTQSMNEAAAQQLILGNNLRKALSNNEFHIYYQPQVSVITGQIIGLEALVRWQHPEKGFISPALFIPLAEETGQIQAIGEWILRQACLQGAKWIKQGFKPLIISVNLSAKQLRQSNLNKMIKNILTETEMPARYLGIELTESAIILEPDMALDRLNKIKSLGIKLSLDDFGTGYSSLSYLKRFPIDTLKIDQAFIKDVKNDPEDAALVKAIIAMGHGMGMDIIAEGVELQEQLEFLSANACDAIQGYLFSKPLPANEIEPLLPRPVFY
ncbi:MAG: EAL domain-containing protein [Gammaproteobacteria bacterium]|nr:EAL domain-containing protein [Gammaproteobacteria bacterium]